MFPRFPSSLTAGKGCTRPHRARTARTHAGAFARVGRAARGFTLVELLVVMAVIVVLVMLIAPAFTQVNAARQLTNAAYDITGALENARAYAKANSTYTWVGFFEEGAKSTAGTAGVGRVIVSAVASKDATAMYAVTDTNPPPLNPSNLIQLGKPLKLENVHLAVLSASEVPTRGKVLDDSGTAANVPAAYQIGDTTPVSGQNFAKRSATTNQTTFPYPLGVAAPTYTFVKIIQFNPLGDASKIVDSPTQLLEIGLRLAHGDTVDTVAKNCVAIQVSGIGGLARIYQP